MEEKNKSGKKDWIIKIILILLLLGAVTYIGLTIYYTKFYETPPTEINPDGVGHRIETLNEHYLKFEGDNVAGTIVKELCRDTADHNKNTQEKHVKVGFVDSENSKLDVNNLDNLVNENGEYGKYYDNIKSSKRYKIKCYYDEKGFVNAISVQEKIENEEEK